MLYFLHKKPRQDLERLSLKSPKNKPKPPPLSQEIIQKIKNQKLNSFHCYHPDDSMAGFFFLDSNNTSFRYIGRYPHLNLPSPSFFNVPPPFTICSSSRGLLLCRDLTTGRYHVFNPFIQTTDSYKRIPSPYRTHQRDTPAVLVVINTDPDSPSFYIICAVQEEYRNYSFDTFSSSDDNWSYACGRIRINARRIVANTGVSNHQGMAFWLTDVPYQVVKYTVDRSGDEFSETINIPRTLNPWAKLQIGRLATDDIGLVASSRSDVRLMRVSWNEDLDLYDWSEIGCLNVIRKKSADHDGGGGVERPELMRFEIEVPLFAGKSIVVWCPYLQEKRSFLLSTRMPSDFGNRVPYVTSELVATKFREMEAEEET